MTRPLPRSFPMRRALRNPGDNFILYGVIRRPKGDISVYVRLKDSRVERTPGGMPLLFSTQDISKSPPIENTASLWQSKELAKPNFFTFPTTITKGNFTLGPGFALAFPGKYATEEPAAVRPPVVPHTPRGPLPSEVQREREEMISRALNRDRWAQVDAKFEDLVEVEPRYKIAQRATQAYVESMSKKDPGVPGQRLNLTNAQAKKAVRDQESLIEEVRDRKNNHAAVRAVTPHAFLSDIYARGVQTPTREQEDEAIRSYLMHIDKAMTLSREPEVLPIERQIAVHLRNKNEGLYYQPRALTPAQEAERRTHAATLINRRLPTARKLWQEAKGKFFPEIEKNLKGERWDHRENAIRSLTSLLAIYGTFYEYLVPGLGTKITDFTPDELSVLDFIGSVARDVFRVYVANTPTIAQLMRDNFGKQLVAETANGLGIDLSVLGSSGALDKERTLDLTRRVNSDRNAYARAWIKSNEKINNFFFMDNEERNAILSQERAGNRERMQSKIMAKLRGTFVGVPMDLPPISYSYAPGASPAATGTSAPSLPTIMYGPTPGSPPPSTPSYTAPEGPTVSSKPASPVLFSGGPFSNFYPATFSLNGHNFSNSEQAFMFFKSEDPTYKSKLLSTSDPKEVKKLGRKVKLRSDWEDIKYGVMVAALLAKFSQNNDLRRKLLDTKDAPIHENRDDSTWGGGPNFPGGLDLLGKALMEVRATLRSSAAGTVYDSYPLDSKQTGRRTQISYELSPDDL